MKTEWVNNWMFKNQPMPNDYLSHIDHLRGIGLPAVFIFSVKKPTFSEGFVEWSTGVSHLQSHLEKLTFKVYMSHGKLGSDFELEVDEVLRFESHPWPSPISKSDGLQHWVTKERLTDVSTMSQKIIWYLDHKSHGISHSSHFFLGWFIIPRTLLRKSRHDFFFLVGETHPLFVAGVG